MSLEKYKNRQIDQAGIVLLTNNMNCLILQKRTGVA